MPWRLYRFEEGRVKDSIELRRRKHVLGNSITADLRVDGPGVIARHAYLKRVRHCYWIYELTKGTKPIVNNKAVHKAPLKHGDRLRLGEVTLVVRLDVDPDEDKKTWKYLKPALFIAFALAVIFGTGLGTKIVMWLRGFDKPLEAESLADEISQLTGYDIPDRGAPLPSGWIRYRIQGGDTLDRLARRFYYGYLTTIQGAQVIRYYSQKEAPELKDPRIVPGTLLTPGITVVIAVPFELTTLSYTPREVVALDGVSALYWGFANHPEEHWPLLHLSNLELVGDEPIAPAQSQIAIPPLSIDPALRSSVVWDAFGKVLSRAKDAAAKEDRRRYRPLARILDGMEVLVGLDYPDLAKLARPLLESVRLQAAPFVLEEEIAQVQADLAHDAGPELAVDLMSQMMSTIRWALAREVVPGRRARLEAVSRRLGTLVIRYLDEHFPDLLTRVLLSSSTSSLATDPKRDAHQRRLRSGISACDFLGQALDDTPLAAAERARVRDRAVPLFKRVDPPPPETPATKAAAATPATSAPAGGVASKVPRGSPGTPDLGLAAGGRATPAPSAGSGAEGLAPDASASVVAMGSPRSGQMPSPASSPASGISTRPGTVHRFGAGSGPTAPPIVLERTIVPPIDIEPRALDVAAARAAILWRALPAMTDLYGKPLTPPIVLRACVGVEEILGEPPSAAAVPASPGNASAPASGRPASGVAEALAASAQERLRPAFWLTSVGVILATPPPAVPQGTAPPPEISGEERLCKAYVAAAARPDDDSRVAALRGPLLRACLGLRLSVGDTEAIEAGRGIGFGETLAWAEKLYARVRMLRP